MLFRSVIRAYCAPTDTIQEGQEHPYQQVRIEIGDTGIGIDAEDQAAIFERFFRVENRVHTLEGTGLGLSIVKNIMDKHNSQVNLVGEVGVGTTFWFDLPVYDMTEYEVPEPMPVESLLEETAVLSVSTAASTVKTSAEAAPSSVA